MNEFAARIERDFSVRRKEKQKLEFRTWLVYTLKELGYTPKLESGEYHDVLFVATGALMSPMLVLQGQSIPGIAHLVRITKERNL